MTRCKECGKPIKEGEHCYGPKEYLGQVSPPWVLCLNCSRNSDYELVSPFSEGEK